MRRTLATIGMLVGLALLTACGERVILTTEDTYTLSAGEIVRGDLEVGTRVVTLERDSRVTGNLTVPAGQLVLFGEVGGDVSVPAGDVTLGPHAVIGGDLTLGTGTLYRADTAVVEGRVIQPGASP